MFAIKKSIKIVNTSIIIIPELLVHMVVLKSVCCVYNVFTSLRAVSRAQCF